MSIGCGPNKCEQLSNFCGRLNSGGGYLLNCCGRLNMGAWTSVTAAFGFETYKNAIVHQYSGWKLIWIGKLDSNYHTCTCLGFSPVKIDNLLRSSVVGNDVRSQVSRSFLR